MFLLWSEENYNLRRRCAIKDIIKYYFSKQIENSKNKMKTVWGITRLLTGLRAKNEDAQHLNTHDNLNYNSQTISEVFNNYFYL